MSLKLQKIKIGNRTNKIIIATEPVSAGFPTPAEDFAEAKLDLNELLIKHPAATYFVRVKGDSMQDIGIHNDDILIVDRALEAREGKIVVAAINNEFTVKRVQKRGQHLYLVAENSKYRPIKIDPNDDFQIFGVVTNVIKCL